MDVFEKVALRRREAEGKLAQRNVDAGMAALVERALGRGDNYLGTPEVVDALLRGAVGRVIRARLDAAEGEKVDPKDVMAKEAAALAGVFLGRNRDFEIIGPQWNSPTGTVIGQIRRRYELLPAEPEAIAAHPFMACVQAYLAAEKAEAEGGDWEHLIDGEIELAVATLIGADEVMFPFYP